MNHIENLARIFLWVVGGLCTEYTLTHHPRIVAWRRQSYMWTCRKLNQEPNEDDLR